MSGCLNGFNDHDNGGGDNHAAGAVTGAISGAFNGWSAIQRPPPQSTTPAASGESWPAVFRSFLACVRDTPHRKLAAPTLTTASGPAAASQQQHQQEEKGAEDKGSKNGERVQEQVTTEERAGHPEWRPLHLRLLARNLHRLACARGSVALLGGDSHAAAIEAAAGQRAGKRPKTQHGGAAGGVGALFSGGVQTDKESGNC